MESTPQNPFNLDKKQQESLVVFKKKLTDLKILPNPIYDDWYILRFLRSQNFNIFSTTRCFTKFHKKRTQYDVENSFSQNI